MPANFKGYKATVNQISMLLTLAQTGIPVKGTKLRIHI